MRIERWLYTVPLRFRSLFRGGRVEEELREEFAFHVDRLTEQYVAAGMTTSDARLAALRAMHGLEQRKEECRDARGIRLLEDVLQDLGYAARTLRRAPGFAAAAIATLALGIGATVAVFTVVNGVLLRPLPFARPDRLVAVTHAPRGPFNNGPSMADADYVAFAERTRTFDRLATYATAPAKLTGSGDPALIAAAGVTRDFFEVLGVPAASGRTFAAGEDDPGHDAVVVVGDAMWRGALASDPQIVGKSITLDGVRRTVIGIMPAGFTFPGKTQAWTPMRVTVVPTNSFLRPVIGRLKPDVTTAQARAEFETIAPKLSDRPTDDHQAWSSGILPLGELVVGDIRRPLEVFAGAIVLVLLIACANVANLLLARGSVRTREIALRTALGAGRARVVRQLLTESIALSFAGGAGGVLLAWWVVPALLALAPEGRIPRIESIAIDGGVLVFALAVSVATGIVFGLLPAVRVARNSNRESLLPAGRTFGHPQDRTRAVLVVAEIALALVLLAGAGLLLRSFIRLTSVDPGFRTDNVMAMHVELDGTGYTTPEQRRAFHTQVLERLSAIPGVVSAGAVNWQPLGTALIIGDFHVEARPDSKDLTMVDKPAVSPGYFTTMGIKLLRGRDFTDRDDVRAPGVAIVSRSVARLFPGEDALGKRVTLQTRPNPEDWLTIVGIVDDVKQSGLAEPLHAAIYRPYGQVSHPFFLGYMTYVVRAADSATVATAMRGALRAVDRNQPTGPIVSMSDVLQRSTADPRFQARLLGSFAALALLLAALGTYSVLAYSVAQRTYEIGIRIALGARRSAVLLMILQRTAVLAGIGVAIGIGGAVAATGVLESALFEIKPGDPGTLAAVAVILMACALAAGLLPALRATRVDPLAAIRQD
jgi:putative ABC transport system permease protein